jgi:hypothetical protein
LDRERPEQADHKAPPILFFHAHALPYLRRSSFHISSARPTQLTGFRPLASMIRYTRYASAQTRLLPLSPGRSRWPPGDAVTEQPQPSLTAAAARQLKNADLITAAGGAAARESATAPCPLASPAQAVLSRR